MIQFNDNKHGNIGYYDPRTNEVGVFVERWNDYLKLGVNRIQGLSTDIQSIETWTRNEYLRKNNLPR